MTEVAGEVCDGFICHGFTTERYLREVTLPAVERGSRSRGARWTTSRSRARSFVVTGTNEDEVDKAAPGRAPADRLLRIDARLPRRARAPRVGRPAGRAQPLSKEGRWKEMGELIDDEILEAFAVVAEPADIATAFTSGTATS